MKIAIRKKGELSSSWIEYCEENRIPYKIVSCYDNDIIDQLEDCDVLMWQHHQARYQDKLFAKQLLFALEHAGKKVFPDFKTGWHFDDKLGQKYVLESINAPLAPTHVFYDKESAKSWVEKAHFPKVFKLRGGSGSTNVSLVKNKKEALKKINQAFGKGFSQFNWRNDMKERLRKFKKGESDFFFVLKGLARSMLSTTFAKMHGREKGYVYFQDFIDGNDCDYRIKVIGQKAWGFIRKVRENDFRASGSNELIFDPNQIPLNMIEIALKIAHQLELQSVAYDFVLDQNQKPLLLEMSYGFGIAKGEFDQGYWDQDLKWHAGKFNPLPWIVEDIVTDKVKPSRIKRPESI